MAGSWSAWVGLCVLALALGIGVVTDLRARTIPNRVTLPALALVLGSLSLAGGWPLLRSSLIGMAVCAVPLCLAALPGWIGMGDVKLMAVCGAAAGFPAALTVLLLVGAAGGLQAALQLGWSRIRGSPAPRHIPYACAIAAGTIAAFAAAFFPGARLP
jgi:Flp pilus assembly protein protease CpaA